MTIVGLDYTDRIDPAVLKAAGVAYVFRYVMPQTPYWTKALRNAEVAELLAAGIGIVSNWETYETRMREGAGAGTTDALQLLADWRALGAPRGLTGWFSADWDVQPAEVPAVLAYLGGAVAVLRPQGYGTGLYGGYRACKAAADAGYDIWQTSGWSYGQWDPRCAARQTGGQLILGGVETDRNTILNPAALGAWGGPSIPSTPGDAMSLSPDEHNVLYQLSNAAFLGGPACGRPIPTAAGNSNAGQNSVFAHLDYMTLLLESLTARPAPTVDPAALAAAIAPLVNASATPEAIAQAVISHLSVTVGTK